jgi:hypothetical protein
MASNNCATDLPCLWYFFERILIALTIFEPLSVTTRVVSIVSARDSDSSGDKVTGSAKKFEYRDH